MIYKNLDTQSKSLPLAPILLLFLRVAAYAHANGKLYLHFMDVGQSEGDPLMVSDLRP